MRLLRLALSAMLAFPFPSPAELGPPAAAEAWILTASNRDGEADYVAPHRIRQVSEDRFTVWVKRVRGKPGEPAPRSYSLVEYEYDCATASTTLLREVPHGSSGPDILLPEREAASAGPRPARSDPLSEASLSAVCRAATATAGP